MTTDGLDKFINIINGEISDKTVKIQIKQTLNKNVFFGVIFLDVESKSAFNDCPYYFVKNDAKFIGIVQNGGSDLHWYIKIKYRGQGHMTKALKKYILPHILKNKEEQLITINEGAESCLFEKSEKLALRLGFKKINESIHLGDTPIAYRECIYKITSADLD
jgi:hypothetical protein